MDSALKYKLVENANLPENKTLHCIIGEGNTATVDELKSLGIICITLNNNPFLPTETSTHADMLCCYAGEGNVFLDKSQKNAENKLKAMGFNVFCSENQAGEPYPNDIVLNAAVIGNMVISKAAYTDKKLLKLLENDGKSVISTKQGYSKCSIAVIKGRAVITDDSDITYLLKKYQYDVLKVSKGSVHLSEKHYGFIGGCCAKLSEDVIYFNGNIEEHSDYSAIKLFLDKYDIKSFYNRSRRLTDIGGILPITELL